MVKKDKKFNNKMCDSNMTFSDCELAILRHAVDKVEELQGEEKMKNPDIQNILNIVEDFIRKKKLICYGGTAINNILPEDAQFYNKDIQLPDYDFFSDKPIEHAKELSDIYHKKGYTDVEAKSGVHYGTFKVFVNYMPIADITFLHPEIFTAIKKESIKMNGIRYAPSNFLRMSMYLELSRPNGDVSRWEKVLKRLELLNIHHPLKVENCNEKLFKDSKSEPTSELNTLIRNSLINSGVVFFGGYSSYLYSNYMPKDDKNKIKNISEYDVLVKDPSRIANILVENLKEANYKDTEIVHHSHIGEIIPEHYEVKVNNKSYAFLFEPIACHSYNKITIDGKKVLVATMETILSLYLAFLYAKMPYYNKERLLCISKLLYNIIQQNKLANKGILKRFSLDCYGKQPTLADMRSEKNEKYKHFKESDIDRDSKEYNMWFFKYDPAEKNQQAKKQTRKNKNIKSSKSKTLKSSTSFLV